MKTTRGVFLAGICLWFAGGCQGALAPRMSLGGAMPDFLLVTIAVFGLFCNRRGGLLLGFWAGLIHGAMAGANLGAYVVTRSVAGMLVGSLKGFEFEPNSVVAGIQGAVLTVVAQVFLMLISPSGSIPRFLLVTIESAMINGVLAAVLFFLMGRMLVTRTR